MKNNSSIQYNLNYYSIKDWGEYEYLRSKVEAEDSFKLMAGPCFTRMFRPDYYDFMMSPLCQF